MPTYFHGWRRKLGVVTLLMACVFAMVWVRSLRVANYAEFNIGQHTLIQLISREATFAVRKMHSELPVESTETNVNYVLLMGWRSRSGDAAGDLSIIVDAALRDSETSQCRSRYRWILNRHGFEIGGFVDEDFPLSVFSVQAPYRSIVIPLTLLSAYLILSKPRASIQKKFIEPVPNEEG